MQDSYGNTARKAASPRNVTRTSPSAHEKPRQIEKGQQVQKRQINVLNLDSAVFLTVTVLAIVGVIMVFSASYQYAANSATFGRNANFFLWRHGFFAITGFALMLLISNINYRLYSNFVWLLYIITIGLLIAVIFLGVKVGGAGRWFELAGIRFQPSEVAKATVIFTIAVLAEKFPTALKTWPGTFWFSATIAGICALVLIPGGFSTTLIIAAIGFTMIFTASPYIARFFVMGGSLVGVVAAYLGITAYLGTGFRGDRVNAWLDPWSDSSGTGFQVIQSLYAVATGGWFGLGIGKSRQASFIPEPQNDMIFAIIIEELGLIGAGLILVLFGIFIWRGTVIALRAADTFGALVAIGIVFMVAFQVIVNVGVVTNTIPNTGVTLPFISYGGTSLWINMALAGVLLNISRYPKA
ncbi:MAG: putative lipid II flippase FtsW [Defluviitaleaceae bacterium]|nr:putative lipid II flippase FtsW [Defluviitaleaceae bacterium]